MSNISNNESILNNCKDTENMLDNLINNMEQLNSKMKKDMNLFCENINKNKNKNDIIVNRRILRDCVNQIIILESNI